jgi:hypothetical protein
MKRLIALYTIRLEECLVIKRREGDSPTFTTSIDGFDVSISLTDEYVAGVRSWAERLMTHDCNAVEVSVSREESESPPPASRTDRGTIDYTGQTVYFDSRAEPYAKVAAEALDRLFLFLRYRLHQPLLDVIRPHDQALQNSKWVDETGAEVGKGPLGWVAQDFPRRFGVIALQAKHDQRVCRALGRRLIPKLHEELLSDAQAAALRGNVRRAVIELAIACEVAVKGKFYGRSVGGRTLEYLEDHRHLTNIRIIDYIAKPAQHVFGENFKTTCEAAYTDLERLFQCRNKVAHRGRPSFRDSAGVVQTANEAVLEQWFVSVRQLFAWLKKLRHR